MPKKKGKNLAKKMAKETVELTKEMARKRGERSARKPLTEQYERMLRKSKYDEADEAINRAKWREYHTRPEKTKIVEKNIPEWDEKGNPKKAKVKIKVKQDHVKYPSNKVTKKDYERVKRLQAIKEAKKKGEKVKPRKVTSRLPKTEKAYPKGKQAKTIKEVLSKAKGKAGKKVLRKAGKIAAKAAVAGTGLGAAYKTIEALAEANKAHAPDLPRKEKLKKEKYNRTIRKMQGKRY
jgi:hypothetical protein